MLVEEKVAELVEWCEDKFEGPFKVKCDGKFIEVFDCEGRCVKSYSMRD